MAVPDNPSQREPAARKTTVEPHRQSLASQSYRQSLASQNYGRRFAGVEEMSLLAEQAARTVADPTAALADAIKAVIASDADPYVLLGVLAEGTVQTLANRVPDARRALALQGFLQIIGSRTQIQR